MKKFKKLISLTTSLILTATSFSCLTVSAVAPKEYAQGTLETVVESFGKDSFMYYYGDEYNGMAAFVVDDDGSAYVFRESYRNTYVTIKEDATLSIDEINKQIAPYSLKEVSENTCSVFVCSKDEQQKVYDTLKTYDEIISIDEQVEVLKVSDNNWRMFGISFANSSPADEVIEMLPELKLSKEFKNPDNSGYAKPGYYHLEFPELITGTTSNQSFYEGMKKLDESDLTFYLPITESLCTGEKCSSGVFNIYTAESAKSPENTAVADFDGNDKVELTDLTAFSLYMVGDTEWTDEQIKNFDCNADGKTDLADLAHLKQYIMGEDVKLG